MDDLPLDSELEVDPATFYSLDQASQATPVTLTATFSWHLNYRQLLGSYAGRLPGARHQT